MTDSRNSSIPRFCRWFGHKPYPPTLHGVVIDFPEPGTFCPTGGFDFVCERCGFAWHNPSDMIVDGFIG